MAQITSKYHCRNLDETKEIALKVAETIAPKTTYAFYGDLGAGKTTFIRTILEFFKIPTRQIQSPTFSYLHSYKTLGYGFNLHHFDVYRIKSEKEFFSLGFEEYLTCDDVCLIEWAENIETILPSSCTTKIYIQHVNEYERKVEIEYA